MVNSRITRRTVVRGMAAGTSLAAMGLRGVRSARAQSEPIRIGCLQTISGAMGDIGKAHVIGAQIAVKMLNDSGGINGRQVELVVRDTKVSATVAVTALRELVGSGINLIVGEAFTTLNLAMSPLMPGLNAVLVSPTTVGMEMTHENFSRNTFRAGPNSFMQYNGQTALLARDHPTIKRWGGIRGDGAAYKDGWDMVAATLKRNFKKLANVDVEVLDPVITKVGTADYRTAANQLVGQNLGGLISILVAADEVTFLKQSKPFGLLKSVGAVVDNNLNVTAGPLLKQDTPNNFYTSCMWEREYFKQYPMAEPFAQAWIAETKNEQVGPFAANAHTAVMSMAAAAKSAGSVATDAIINALESITFDSVYGPLQFRKEDHQLKIGPGYMELAPQDAEPGWRMVKFVRVDWQDAIEPPTPGVAFRL